ncbi:hypothetical protein BUE67_15735, partial [Corynebacterium diphtheriae]
SASLTINENADPTVRSDFESFFNRCVKEHEAYYVARITRTQTIQNRYCSFFYSTYFCVINH